MTKEFNKISTKEETRYVLETASGGASSAGSIASVSMPVGGTTIQRRPGDNLLTPESDTVKQKPRQGPLRTQTGGGKHKDKTKTIPRKAKHKTPVAETKPMSAREKLNKDVNLQRQKDKDARTGLSGIDHDQYQRQLQAKLDKKTAVSESLSPGEYYLWTVKLDDGSTKKMKWSSSYHFPETEEINQHFEKKYGKKVVDVDFDFAVHGGNHITPPEPHEPGGPGKRVNSYGEPMKESDVLEAIPGGTDTMNFMHDTVGIPKDEVGYAVMLLRKKQTGKTLSPREEADWVAYEKKLRVALMVRKNQSVAEGQDLDMDMIARRLEPGMQTDDEVIEAAYHYIRLHYDKITAGATLRDPANQKELLNFYKSKMTPLDFRREGAEKTLSNPQHKLGKDIDAGRKADEASRIRAKKAKDEFEKEWKAKQEKGVAEGKEAYNFDADDIKRLEQIKDLPTLKAQAMALIAKPSAKPIKPEKVQWFKNTLENMNSPIKVIKLMYDLLLSGQGHAVIGSRNSMSPNSYRSRFGEGDEYNEYSDEVDMVKNNLLTIIRACKELANTIESGENLPEWVEEKVSMSKQNMVTVSQYLQSQHQQGHVYEKMMPASMFAGSDKNKLGVAGQWRNKGPKKNKPAKAGDLVGGDESIQYEASDEYHQRLQWNLEAAVDERSVSQAQARTMAAAAHNPEFAKKVGIKTNVAQEFNRADTGKDISKLPVRVIPKKRKK